MIDALLFVSTSAVTQGSYGSTYRRMMTLCGSGTNSWQETSTRVGSPVSRSFTRRSSTPALG